MANQTIHRIYTEEKNKRAILDLMARSFDSFSVQPILGYYRGKKEKSIVLEVVGASAREICGIADKIKKMNGQTSVLTITLHGTVRSIR